MKTFTDAAMKEIAAGTAIVSGAVEILGDVPIRLWGGYGPLTFANLTFDPIGDRGIAQVSGGALGGAAQAVTLRLSGIDPEALALLDADEVKRAPGTLWRLIFSGDGQRLLDWHVYTRGRLDPLAVKDVIGGEATISTSIESAARGLGRKGGRMRTDADQRLIRPDDGFFRNVSFAGERNLYWGGQKPATVTEAIGGMPAGSGAGSGGGSSGRGVSGRQLAQY